MIREELLRTPTNASNVPSPQLHVFLSKSPPNYNYVFYTNDPTKGNLDIYGVKNFLQAYRQSCPPASHSPYFVNSCKVVNSRQKDLQAHRKQNPSGLVNKRVSSRKGRHPVQIVRVELDKRLRGTGRLNIGRSGWSKVSREQLKDEPYRTDENAVVEYLFHIQGGYRCKRLMIGDYGVKTNVHDGIGYRPFGACYPRFYFLKLIPLVGRESLIESDPYAQMDFYFRAMCGEFVMPFNPTFIKGQMGHVSFKFSQLASKSSEEDPSAYYYVDPREVQS
jgi:hypothetical protein